MAEYGEWNQKAATLGDVTAKAEYDVSRDFFVKRHAGRKVQIQRRNNGGKPYLGIPGSQLEHYRVEEFGDGCLIKIGNETELRKVKREISGLKKKLDALQN